MYLSNLPAQPTLFVGRVEELHEIVALLSDPACRLLTLVGPGGIGKTRLALRAAQRVTSPVAVHFVAFQSLGSPDFMVSTIAESIDFHFYAGSTPKQQLLNHLRDQSILLVLDNLEHLLNGVMLLSEILDAAPQVRIMATSRERLNLREEWVLQVGGLNIPSAETITDLQHYSAIELFVQHAQRANVGFRLTETDEAAVVRICRLVGGMPLGIELAASWVRALSCSQIADEIELSLDILEAPTRNVEPRHRTMRAAFEPTWERLSEAEQSVFKYVSVFRGGFTREAAEYVAGASLRTLTALVDKSLLRLGSGGRYDLHELMRQYGEEKLAETPTEQAEARDRHAVYYAHFIDGLVNDTVDVRHKDAVTAIGAEIENVRAAFHWAVEAHRFDELGRFLEILGSFYEVQGWYYEGAEMYHRAAEGLRKPPDEMDERQTKLLGLALSWQAALLLESIRNEEARQLAREGLELLLPHGMGIGVVCCYHVFSFTAPDNAEAREFALAALKCAEEIDYYIGGVVMRVRLSQLHFVAGQYAEALQMAQDALALCRKHNYRYGEIYALQRLSDVASAYKDYGEAKRRAQQALAIAESIGTRNGIPLHHLTLGTIALAQQAYSEAKQHYQQSMTIAQSLGQPAYVMWAMCGLGRVAGRMGKVGEARAHFRELITMMKDVQDKHLQRDTLVAIADMMAAQGYTERAVGLLVHRIQNPDNIGRFRLTDERLRDELQASLSLEAFAGAWERGTKLEPEALLAELWAEFNQPDEAIEQLSDSGPITAVLSEREIEILRLAAEGLTNREIADRLTLAVSTVKWYINEIFSELHAANRTQAVAHARALGLLRDLD